ncbi:prostaglandin reductase 1-like isoform X2 [Mizuhopecten yessoensis]|uniref:prostaglandin reductase 1-like isoform X2 n=1 Tax=Mizuhopecten yessoensis TaxID=6573 RepID=UPI000B45A399|nr:prostaglandin reductase 1-like isoform X2 [Mizuhopecten yessoensis]
MTVNQGCRERIPWTIEDVIKMSYNYTRDQPIQRFQNLQALRYRVIITSAIPPANISMVIASKSPSHPVGSVVRAFSGWRTHTLVSNEQAQGIGRIPEMSDLPLSLALGTMGMTGMTAYFGFLELCQPKEGDTVLVNGAAGAVGSLVGQIAKIKGCKVVGCAGTDDKCKWLKELGFDEVFNYKKVDLSEALKAAAPDGFDCFFDNIGADFTATALKHMKQFGRVSICGQMSVYNNKELPRAEYPFMLILGKQLKVEGFNVMRWYPRWAEGEKVMAQWIKEGKIKYKETITKGFRNMPNAFIGLFDGANTGKAIVTA